MTWTKLSDDFADDSWTLSDAAFRLHVEGLTWSARKLLDLRIPRDELPRCSKRPEAVHELVAVGWWSDEGGSYVIRHHAAYQRTREQVLAQQEANAENGRKGGRPPKVPREQASSLAPETQSVSESVTQSVSESPSERDGTGQDWLTTGTTTLEVEPAHVTRDEPPTLRVVDPPTDGRSRWTSTRKCQPCVVCGQGARLALDDQPTHPACRADVPIDLPERRVSA